MKRIKGFDGLRAIAVTSVFVGHMRPLGVPLSAVAVYFFFVLSGFLITGILTDQRQSIEENRTGAIPEIRSFYFRRSLRIFPIYYLTLFLYASWLAFDSGQWPAGMLSYVFYYSNIWMLYQNDCNFLLCHFWSLAVEEQFYVFLAPLLIFLALALHLRIMAGVFIFGTLSLLLAPLLGLTPHAQYWLSTTNFAMLAAGGFVSVLSRRQPTLKISTGIAIAATIVVVAFIGGSEPLRSHVPILYYPFFWITIIGITTMVTWLTHHQESSLVRLLEWRPIRYLGVVSYGFYLIHPATIHIYRAWVTWPTIVSSTLPKDGLAAINALACFGLTFLISHLSWKFFEKPILSLRDSGLPPAPLEPINLEGRGAL